MKRFLSENSDLRRCKFSNERTIAKPLRPAAATFLPSPSAPSPDQSRERCAKPSAFSVVLVLLPSMPWQMIGFRTVRTKSAVSHTLTLVWEPLLVKELCDKTMRRKHRPTSQCETFDCSCLQLVVRDSKRKTRFVVSFRETAAERLPRNI